MANPFFRNHWNPIRHDHYHQAPTDPHPIKPKVINIPVHFVGSHAATTKQSPPPATENMRRAAAVTIQRIARGFLVRKNARVVRQIAKEVEEIERRLREEKAKMIQLSAKERLLVNEMLLALLLRLDSVRGVRDIRKKVIRRVISLQDAIDNAENQEDSRNDDSSENLSVDHDRMADQTPDLVVDLKEETDLEMEVLAEVESSEKQSELTRASDVGEEEEGSGEVAELSAIDQTLNQYEANVMTEAIESPVENGIVETQKVEEKEEVEDKRREERGIREMAEKLAAENEVLKGMVTQLCAEQCKLIKGLVERVDQLERFVHHRIDRRKKRRSAK